VRGNQRRVQPMLATCAPPPELGRRVAGGLPRGNSTRVSWQGPSIPLTGITRGGALVNYLRASPNCPSRSRTSLSPPRLRLVIPVGYPCRCRPGGLSLSPPSRCRPVGFRMVSPEFGERSMVREKVSFAPTSPMPCRLSLSLSLSDFAQVVGASRSTLDYCIRLSYTDVAGFHEGHRERGQP